MKKIHKEFNEKIEELLSDILPKLDGDITCLLLYKYKNSREIKMLETWDRKEISLMLHLRDSKGMRDIFDYNIKKIKTE